MLFASRSATQREWKPSARPIGALRPVTTLVGLFVPGSMRVTTPSPDEAGQCAPAAQTARWSAARKPQGWPDRSEDNRIVAEILLSSGSMRTTAPRFVTVA
jgi:hypothetical protein